MTISTGYFSTIAALKAIDTSALPTGYSLLVAGPGTPANWYCWFTFDQNITASGDDYSIIKPSTGPGGWMRDSSTSTSGGSSSSGGTTGDPYFNNVALLCHFDGSNNSTTFTDIKGHSLSPLGSPTISTTQSKFSGSGYFPGGSTVISPSNSDWLLGNGDFTIETWVYRTGVSYYGSTIVSLWQIGGSGNNSWNFLCEPNTGYLALAISTTGGDDIGVSSGVSVPTNQWVHVAVTRSSGNLMFFINGVQAGATVSRPQAFFNSTAPLIIGGIAASNTAGIEWLGNIDELRITAGVARYTSNFSLPTAAFPDSAPSSSSSSSSNTSGWRKIAEAQLTSAADYTISGLNGNIDEIYEVILDGILTIPSGASADYLILARPNNDANSGNYKTVGTQIYNYQGTAYSTPVFHNTETGLIIGSTAFSGSQLVQTIHSKTQISASSSSGKIRSSISICNNGVFSGNLGRYEFSSYWNNTSDNITSLTFNFGGATSFSGVIQVFASGGTSISSALQTLSYAKLSETQSNGTGGGVVQANTDIIRTLNTIDTPQNWVSLANNQFTLAPGIYIINAESPAYEVNRFRIWLKNITSNTIALYGSTGYAAASSDTPSTYSIISGQLNVTTATTYEIHFQSQYSNNGIYGLGVNCGITGQPEVYTTVELTKIA